jgi:CRISPR type III-associated protein (TIGR04423 family)
MNKIEIAKKCEGYIWYSDKPQPEKIAAEQYSLELDESKNPFVVEGQIYSEDANASYSIKYVDGKYIVIKYELDKLGKNYDEKSFIANRLENVARIKFRQYWKRVEDDLCEGMITLVPAEYVFVGFEFNDKEKEEKLWQQ